MSKAAEQAPDSDLVAEVNGCEQAIANRTLTAIRAKAGKPDVLIAQALADYRAWLKADWHRGEAQRRRV